MPDTEKTTPNEMLTGPALIELKEKRGNEHWTGVHNYGERYEEGKGPWESITGA